MVDKIAPQVIFEKKTKSTREVLQHFQALIEAIRIGSEFINHAFANILLKKYSEEKAIEIWKYFLADRPFPGHAFSLPLFTEEHIMALHKIMADGLLPEDTKVNAGEYRIDIRTVGNVDVVFPSPAIVPDCMKKFVEDANTLFLSHFVEDAGPPFFAEQTNIFEIAARISYDFVRIHPFPDFNGRLSRLLLMMLLLVYGVPFPITLRGDKKGRKRYFTSLKRANNHNIIPYAALIAMRVVETFQEIDENIVRAGYPSILSFDEDTNREKSAKDS